MQYTPQAQALLLPKRPEIGESVQQIHISSSRYPLRLLLALLAILGAMYFHYSSPQFESTHALEDLFAIIDIPGKGKGMVATRDIKQGELIITERPLFTVPLTISGSPTVLLAEKLRQLDSVDYQRFLNLSYVTPGPQSSIESLDEIALAIFQTNAVSAGKNAVGIFPTMARLNHGCSSAFNVVYSWRDDEENLVVHALKAIGKGEELLTTYTDTKKARKLRHEFLSQSYGFNCSCAVCSLPSDESLASDARLTSMSELYERLSSWGRNQITGKEATEIANMIWELGEQEGYLSERGRLAADAAWVAASHADAENMRAWGALAIQWYSYELGGDSRLVKEMKGFFDDPRHHPSWSTRAPASVAAPNFNVIKADISQL